MNVEKRKIQRMIIKPINYLFQLYQSKNKVEICIEKNKKKNTINNLGRIMLKGDNITLIRAI